MNEEQITKLESEVKKQKDPKKVAAGKALARKNAEGRKILKQDEISSSQGESSTHINVSTIYNGMQSIAGIVGTGFTLYHGWKFYESYRKPTTPKLTTPEPPPKKSIRKPADF